MEGMKQYTVSELKDDDGVVRLYYPVGKGGFKLDEFKEAIPERHPFLCHLKPKKVCDHNHEHPDYYALEFGK